MNVDQAVVSLLIQETCGDMVALKARIGDSDGESWSESEGLSSFDFREHNVESLSLHVIGLSWSGENVSLFLEDWEPARVALSCHVGLGCVVPGNARGLVVGLPLPGRTHCHSKRKPFSHRGWAVIERRGMW